MKIEPSYEAFLDKTREGNLIPVWAEILADMETPVSAFKKFEDSEYAFLLESVEQGDRQGRYSFIGSHPRIVIRSRGREVMVLRGGDETERHDRANVLEFLREFMSRYRPVAEPRLPPFIGGAVGYMSYDLVRSFEKLPDNNPDDLLLPDSFFLIADSLVVFDHARRRALLIHNAHVESTPEAAYMEATHRIQGLAERLRGRVIRHSEEPLVHASRLGDAGREVRSNFTREEFKAAVEKAREYILAGDAFQIVLSQRFKRAYSGQPFDIYRALRTINPSPYMFYLKFGDMKLAGSSPEILVTVEDGEVRIRPIAGTRPRGATPAEDKALAAELLADPKELAEHIMLVDLGRNDCGRVCEPGTVRVTALKEIEHYSHVMHIVSNVTGRIKADCDGFDAVEAALPAGTLSGAPKIRAMEIIDELENVRRGSYGGACGYFGFNGNVETCIIIRTVLLKDDIAYVQAGAGLVADSNPEMEYEETLNKSRGMIAAIEMAEQGLD